MIPSFVKPVSAMLAPLAEWCPDCLPCCQPPVQLLCFLSERCPSYGYHFIPFYAVNNTGATLGSRGSTVVSPSVQATRTTLLSPAIQIQQRSNRRSTFWIAAAKKVRPPPYRQENMIPKSRNFLFRYCIAKNKKERVPSIMN